MKEIGFSYERERMFSGYDGKYCKVCPQIATDGEGTAFLTWQMLLLSGSDVFFDTYIAKSTDGGQSFGAPKKRVDLQWTEDGIRMAPFGWLLYNRHHKRWFGLGETSMYACDDHQILVNEVGITRPLQFFFDPDVGDWTGVAPLPFPFEAITIRPCPQIVECDNGDILVPFYYKTRDMNNCAVITVRYAFFEDGLRIVAVGEPISGEEYPTRGLLEPALARCGDRYYLTLRNDERGYFAYSDDGFHFSAPIPWCFDDGRELGNYNTMQHWVVHRDGLFLAYTRRGAHNDHVFRHRAPIFMARFDEERMCILRESEVILVPELGTRLGNFNVVEADASTAWLITAEWMQPRGCEKYGSDNSLWRARIHWR